MGTSQGGVSLYTQSSASAAAPIHHYELASQPNSLWVTQPQRPAPSLPFYTILTSVTNGTVNPYEVAITQSLATDSFSDPIAGPDDVFVNTYEVPVASQDVYVDTYEVPGDASSGSAPQGLAVPVAYDYDSVATQPRHINKLHDPSPPTYTVLTSTGTGSRNGIVNQAYVLAANPANDTHFNPGPVSDQSAHLSTTLYHLMSSHSSHGTPAHGYVGLNYNTLQETDVDAALYATADSDQRPDGTFSAMNSDGLFANPLFAAPPNVYSTDCDIAPVQASLVGLSQSHLVIPGFTAV